MSHSLQIQDFTIEKAWVIQVLKSHYDHHMVAKFGNPGILLEGLSLKMLISFSHIWNGYVRNQSCSRLRTVLLIWINYHQFPCKDG